MGIIRNLIDVKPVLPLFRLSSRVKPQPVCSSINTDPGNAGSGYQTTEFEMNRRAVPLRKPRHIFSSAD